MRIMVNKAAVYIAFLSIVSVALFLPGCAVQDAHPVEEPAPPPPIQKPVVNYFTITPQSIVAGNNATMLWDITDAVSITLGPSGEDIPRSGSRVITPSSSTSYTLTATNSAGTVTRTQYLKVYPEETTLVGVDPVTGRNEGIGFRWEQLCLATGYQVQIAKDPGFSLLVFDSGIYSPAVSTDPAMLYAPGGVLEAGHTYYWRARVRQTASGDDIRSPWSAPTPFIISQGVPVAAPYEGVQLLKPANNCERCPVDAVSFAWTPFKDTRSYSFILAENPGLTEIVISTRAEGTAWTCNGKLKYDTTYFWQVQASDPVPSEPSAIFCFTTEPLPSTQPAQAAAPDAVRQIPPYVWLVIVVGVLLIIAVLVSLYLMLRNRHSRTIS